MRHGALIALSLLASTPALAQTKPAGANSGIEVAGGVGGGAYIFRIRGGDPKQIVPFREVGATARMRTSGPWSFGLQASVRQDLAGEDAPDTAPIATLNIGATPGAAGGSGAEPPDDAVHAGSRWRLAPYAQYEWRDLRLRGGIVAGNYYNPLDSERGGVFLYPQASARVGNRFYGIELGLLDSPALAASANGGLGVMAMRVGLAVGEGHDLLFGVGAPYQGPGADGRFAGRVDDGGYLSYAYQAHFSSLTLDIGGYHGTRTTGAYVTVGTVLR